MLNPFTDPESPMRRVGGLAALVVAGGLTFTGTLLSGCDDEGPFEEAAENVEESAEEAGENIEEGAEEVGEELE